jgi:hypothetical protein
MPEAVRREFVGITDQALDALRQRIEHTVEPWCYEATRDNIRHYAHGIGDDNPSHGKHYVECVLMAENQEGELSARGTVVAQLPSRTG